MELFLIAVAWLFGIISGLYFKIGIVLFVFVFIILCIVGTFRKCNKKSAYLLKINRYLKIVCKKNYIFIFIACYLISYFQITFIEKSFNTKYKNIEKEVEVVGTIISNPSKKSIKLLIQYK